MWGVLSLLSCASIGFLLRIIAGLAPGIHVNTMIPIPFILSDYLPLTPLEKAVIIMSAAVTQTFHDFIPATIIGAPEGETALGILPAHRMLLMSRGYECLRLAAFGSLGAMLLSLILVFPMIKLCPLLLPTLTRHMFILLLAVVFVMVVSERRLSDMVKATVVFLISGVYGIVIMDSHLLSESDALFPTFTGLFGLSTLLLSVRDEVILPPQPLEGRFQIGASRLLSSLMKGSLSGICVALLPGVGASSAAVLFNLSQKEKTLIDEGRGVREFIVSVCGVGTANAIYALVALYVIDKPRSGAVVAVRTVMGKVTAHDFFLLLSVILLVSGASVFTMLALSRIALRQVYRFDYRTMCISIVVMLLLLVTYFTGMTGLLVCIVGICIGVLPPLLGIKRSHCMGVLLVPVILWYGGFK